MWREGKKYKIYIYLFIYINNKFDLGSYLEDYYYYICIKMKHVVGYGSVAVAARGGRMENGGTKRGKMLYLRTLDLECSSRFEISWEKSNLIWERMDV